MFYSQVTDGILTGELESVHALYTKYAPKRTKFSYEGMKARLNLAAIDHNTSVNRDNATTKTGQLRYKVQYSKAAKAYVVKPVKNPKQHDFRIELLKGITNRAEKGMQFCFIFY